MNTVTPDTNALRADVERCRKAEASLAGRAAAFRARLPELAQELATAMADNDERRVNALREERATAEAELRDVDAAVSVASRRTEVADAALARVEAEALFAEVAAECSAFLAELTRLNARSSAIRAKRRALVSRFAAAGFDGGDRHPLHPSKAVRLGSAGQYVYGYLAELEDRPFTPDA